MILFIPLIISSVFSSSFEALADETIAASLSNLCPGSLANCQRVSLRCNRIASAVICSLYMKDVIDKRVFDVEKLFDLYHEFDEDEDFERPALKKLVESIFDIEPDAKWPEEFRILRENLFSESPSFMPSVFATKRFPELCRMVLKHKRFQGKLSIFGRKFSPKWFPLVVPHFVDSVNDLALWGGMAERRERELSLILAKSMPCATPLMKKMMNEGLQSVENATMRVREVYLPVLLANETNISSALKILKAHMPFIRFLAQRPESFILNCHPAVVSFLFENFNGYNETTMQAHTLFIARSSNPMTLYRSLRGPALVDSCVTAVTTFMNNRVCIENPPTPSRTLVETAIFMGYDEGEIKFLAQAFDVLFDEGLLLLAQIKGLDLSELEELIQYRQFDLKKILKNAEILPLIKKLAIPLTEPLIVALGFSPTASQSLSMLLMGTDKRTFSYALVRNIFITSKSNGLACKIYSKCVHDIDELRMLINDCLVYGIHFVPPKLAGYKGRIKSIFSEIGTETLVNSIIIVCEDWLAGSDSTLILAAQEILARPDGFEMLKKHMNNSIDFHLLSLEAGENKTDLLTIINVVDRHPNLKPKLQGYLRGRMDAMSAALFNQKDAHEVAVNMSHFFDEGISLQNVKAIGVTPAQFIRDFLSHFEMAPEFRSELLKEEALVSILTKYGVDVDTIQFRKSPQQTFVHQ